MEEICKMRIASASVKEICESLDIGKSAVYRSLKIDKFKKIREKYGLE